MTPRVGTAATPVREGSAGKVGTAATMKRIYTLIAHPLSVNLLEQAREKIDPAETRELANNIVEIGLLQNSSVGELTTAELRRYLARHNDMWGTSYRVRDLHANFSTGTFLVACFGHRRIEAHLYIWNVGCDSCVMEYGAEEPGTCWMRHPENLDPEGVELRAVRGLKWTDAMYAQAAENTYRPIPRDREAVFWRKLWEAQRELDPTFTLKKFASMVGRSSAIVSEALRFCDLPDEVRDAVSKGYIAWGIAIELLRLQSAGCSASEIIYRKNYAMIRTTTVAHFRAIITGVLVEQAMDQDGLFELNVEEVRTRALAGDLEQSALRTLHAEQQHLLAKLAALRNGDLKEFAHALRTPSVQRALAAAEEVHSGLGLHVV